MGVSLSRYKALGYAAASLVLSGCGFFSSLDEMGPGNSMEYRRAETLPPLEIPPDLSAEAIQNNIVDEDRGTATYLEYREHASNPLMEIYGIEPAEKPHLMGQGDQQRLLVHLNQAEAWDRARGFWLKNGAKIKAEDIRLGFMDVMGPSGQSSYRVRFAQGKKPQTTVIYINLKQPAANPNPRREEVMLRQLAQYLGTLRAQHLVRARQSQGSQSAAAPTRQIHLLNGGAVLQMGQYFSRAWHQVGLVLDKKGFTVEDRNRSQGIYYIRYDDPFAPQQEEDSGWFSSLAFWEEDTDKSQDSRYQIKLISEGPVTRVVILDAKGRRDESKTAKRLLSLLNEQLAK